MNRYLCNEELFDELHEAHIAKGHGGRDLLKAVVKEKFANVTQEVVMAYLSCCEPCSNKRGKTRKQLVVKAILSENALSRMQVDYIDLQSTPDGKYKLLLHLQDHMTKFCLLAATENKTAEVTAAQLKKWFCIVGAPVILQSDNGREFVNKVVEEMLKTFNVKVLHGKPRHSQCQGSVEREITMWKI